MDPRSTGPQAGHGHAQTGPQQRRGRCYRLVPLYAAGPVSHEHEHEHEHEHPHTFGTKDAHGITPILNVSSLPDSFTWFAHLGWEKLWDWSEPGGEPSFGAVG